MDEVEREILSWRSWPVLNRAASILSHRRAQRVMAHGWYGDWDEQDRGLGWEDTFARYNAEFDREWTEIVGMVKSHDEECLT